jgi:hypothetical protein
MPEIPATPPVLHRGKSSMSFAYVISRHPVDHSADGSRSPVCHVFIVTCNRRDLADSTLGRTLVAAGNGTGSISR